MTFEQYLAQLPRLHSWDGGQTWDPGGFWPEQLRPLHGFLRDNLPEGARTLETGAGNTTITTLFLRPARHVAICPDAALFGRITAYCDTHRIDRRALEPIVDVSEWQLPRMAEATREGGASLDLGIIDGGHNFPQLFIDFFYINFMLREGGFLLVDDLQLHSCKELARLLSEQPGFEVALDLGKSLLFRKRTAARDLGDWGNSPYVVRASDAIAEWPDPHSLRLPPEQVRDVAVLQKALFEAESRERALRTSTSWRVTAPLRALGRLLQRG
jgi:hypothetical protein